MNFDLLIEKIRERQEGFTAKTGRKEIWNPDVWIVNLMSKIGELAQTQKYARMKIYDRNSPYFKNNIAIIISDIIIYTIALAICYKVNIVKSLWKTFNMKSLEVDSDVFIKERELNAD